jgi:long-chain acyl-CoA synthetase
MMTNWPQFHLVDAAVSHLGAVPFWVYNTLAPGQLRHVLNDAGARVAVAKAVRGTATGRRR